MTTTPLPNAEDIAHHYRAAHQRLADLAGGFDDAQVATPVPATPGWTVHDVIAHLAANTTDGLAGRITGRPSEEFTAAQVATRKAASIAELFDEWRPNVDPILDAVRGGQVGPALAVDAVTHEQDIRGALGLARVPDAAAIRFCLRIYTAGLGRGLGAASLPALRVRSTDTDFEVVAGEGEPAAEVAAPEYELFRAIAGRRGRQQVDDYAWSGEAKAHRERLNIFGVVPDHVVTD